MQDDVLKWLHVLSAALLVGGGLGSAFHLVFASAGRRPAETAAAAHTILRFDAIVAAPTALFQLAGGFWMLRRLNLSWQTDWVVLSLMLYGAVAAIWVPVVILEFRLRRLARNAASSGLALPGTYWISFFVWLALGAGGFALFAGIFWLMLTKRVP